MRNALSREPERIDHSVLTELRTESRSWVLFVVLLVLASCGPEPSSDPDPSEMKSRVTKNGVFQAGVDIRPGVYTTPTDDMTCSAIVSRTADFDTGNDTSDSDDYLRGATAADKGQRIEVHMSEFLHNLGCEWQRESATGARSDDPATLAGGCAILTGKSGAMTQAMKYPMENESPADKRRRRDIQSRLFALVVANNPKLSDPAGQLVDFLDNPEAAVVKNGSLDDSITAAVETIENTCG